MTRSVLIVDDDRAVLDALAQTLDLANLTAISTASFVEAKGHMTRDFAGVVITDMMMPGRDGFYLLDFVKGVDPDLPVILLTGQGNVPTTVQAIDQGAHAVLEKPCAPADLLACVEKALAARHQTLQARELRRDVARGDAAARL